MNKPQIQKVSGIFALFLLGGVLGLPLGSYLVEHEFIDNEKAIGMWSEEIFFDGFAKKEFAYADPRSAREALQYAIEVHKEMQSKSVLWGRPEKSDLAWCYAELSLIEEAAGNADLARDHMTQAQQTLKEAGSKDPSEAHIREVLQRKPVSNPPPSGWPR